MPNGGGGAFVETYHDDVFEKELKKKVAQLKRENKATFAMLYSCCSLLERSGIKLSTHINSWWEKTKKKETTEQKKKAKIKADREKLAAESKEQKRKKAAALKKLSKVERKLLGVDQL